jgi:hypothetical protein
MSPSAWATESIEVAQLMLTYVTLCVSLSRNFGMQFERSLMSESTIVKHTIAWGMVSAAIAAALGPNALIAAVDRIGIALRGAPDECWMNLVERLCDDTQNVDGPWVIQIWEQMLIVAPSTVLESRNGKTLFEGVFRSLNTKICIENKHRILQSIRLASQQASLSAPLEIIRAAWTWS